VPQHSPKFVLYVIAIIVIMCGLTLFDVQPVPYEAMRYGYDSVGSSLNEIRPTHPASPFSTLITIALAFLIPPLPLIHQYLLGQVYRYAFQLGEQQDWNRLSWMITGAISSCAAVAIALWYNITGVTFSRIVLVMTLICVALGAGGAIWIGRKRLFSRRFIFLLALAAGLVSLVVPFGVVGVWMTWPVVLTGVICYSFLRNRNEEMIERGYAAATNWQVDSLTLGGMAVVALCLLAIVPIISIPNNLMRDGGATAIVLLLILFPLFGWVLNWITQIHLSGMSSKKKNNESGAVSQHFFGYWVWTVVAWGALSIVTAVAIFFGQMMAFFVFSTLSRL